ncbi:MAG: MFS transporter [Eubacteriales bacterium]
MEETRPQLWTKNFIIFFISTFSMNIAFQFLNPTLPLFATKALGAAQSNIGYLLGGYSLAALLIRPFSGYAYDFLGRKKVYAITMGLFAIVSFFYPLMSTFLLLVALRSFHGLIFGFTSTGMGAIVGDIVPSERRGEGIGYFGLAQTLSMALGPSLALLVMGENNYLRLFLTVAALTVVAFLFSTMLSLPPQPLPNRTVNLKTLLEKRVFGISCLHMMTGIVNGGIMSYIIIYSQEIGIINGGLYFLMNGIGVTLTRLFAGRLLDKYGPRYILSFGFIGYSLGLVILSLSDGLVLFLAAAFWIGLGNGIIMPSLQTMSINIVEPESRGVASTTFYAFTDIGIGGGSIFLGLLSGILSLNQVFLFSALYLIIPLVIFNLFVMKDYSRKLEQINNQDQ